MDDFNFRQKEWLKIKPCEFLLLSEILSVQNIYITVSKHLIVSFAGLWEVNLSKEILDINNGLIESYSSHQH